MVLEKEEREALKKIHIELLNLSMEIVSESKLGEKLEIVKQARVSMDAIRSVYYKLFALEMMKMQMMQSDKQMKQALKPMELAKKLMGGGDG